jgi:hypothetical protein
LRLLHILRVLSGFRYIGYLQFMKRILTLLFAAITISASAQEIKNVLDTTKVTSRDFSFGIRRNAIDLNSPLFLLGEEEIKQDQLLRIKPDDISSVTVLKDSTAVARYGDKGKFGVVIIEMKNPKFKLKQAAPHKKE